MGRVSKEKMRETCRVKSSGNSKNQSGKVYKAGIYARLSADIDDRKNESIDVQIEIARKFIEEWNKKHPDKIEEAGCYPIWEKQGQILNRDNSSF